MTDWREEFRSKYIAYQRLSRISRLLSTKRIRRLKHLRPNEKALLETVYGKLSEGWEGVQGKLRALERDLDRLGQHSPLWRQWLKDVSGVRGMTAGLLDIWLLERDFKSRSALKKFCGWYAEDGKLIKIKKGERAPYSPALRALTWVIRENLYNFNREYRRIAEIYYQYYRAKGIEPKIALFRAKIKMLVLFLSHLWEEMYRIKYKREPPLPKANGVLGVYIPPVRDKCQASMVVVRKAYLKRG